MIGRLGRRGVLWLLGLAVGSAALWWLATSLDARLFAIESDDGWVRWSAELPAGTRGSGSPVVGGGRVMIQTVGAERGNTSTYPWAMSAYEATTGRALWSYTPPDEVPLLSSINNWNVLRGTTWLVPALADEHVVVGIISYEGTVLVVLNTTTGQLAWTLERVGFGDNSHHTEVTAAGGRVFVPLRDDPLKADGLTMLALDERDGSQQWSTPLGSVRSPDHDSGPFLAATTDTVYVSTSLSLIALDTATGMTRFRLDETIEDRGGAIMVADGLLLRRLDGETIVAHDLASGEIRWQLHHPLGAGSGPLRAFNARDGLLAVTCLCDRDRRRYAGLLFAVDPTTGTERWRAALSDSGAAYFDRPVVTDGIVVTSGEEIDDVVARSAADGSVRWRLPRRQGSMVATDGHLVYAADRGRLWRHCLALLGWARQSASFD